MSGHRRMAPFVSSLLISVVTFFLVFMIGCAGTAANPSAANASGSSPSGASPGGSSGSGGTTSGGTSSGGGSTSGGTSSGGTSSGGTSGGSSSGGGSSGGSGNMATAIYGSVIDQATQAPISGQVAVALEKMAGDFQLVQQVMADQDGKFVFNNVAPNENYALVFNAEDASGSFYTPLVIAGGTPWNAPSITPGSNVGTITLAHSAEPTHGTITTQVSSSSAANMPAPVSVQFVLRIFLADFEFTLPWTDGTPTVNTTSNNCADSTTACASITMTVPTDPAQFMAYGYHDRPNVLMTQEDYTAHALAFNPTSKQPDCSPSVQDGYAPPMNRGDNVNSSNVAFTGCQ